MMLDLLKPGYTLKIFLLIIISAIGSQSMAQNQNNSKLLGKWSFERHEFLNVDGDTTDMKNESKGLIISFEKGNARSGVGKPYPMIKTSGFLRKKPLG